MDGRFDNPDFPTVDEIVAVCREHVGDGEWPGDDWLWFRAFALNLETEEVTGEKSVTFYAMNTLTGRVNTASGVHITVEAGKAGRQ